MKKYSYAVLGAGSAGHALAVLLSKTGHSVKMYDIDQNKINALQQAKAITSSGTVEGLFPISMATTDPKLAVEDCDILMVATLTCNVPALAEAIAPYIKPSQIIVLNPSATCGALEFRNILLQHHFHDLPIIAETQDLVCTCRSHIPGSVEFTGIKSKIDLATLPAEKASEVCRILTGFYPNFIPQKNVLYTSLGNMAPINHPGPTILNITRVEEPGEFHYFKEGFTPSIGQVVEAMDQERRNIARKFGIELISVKEWLYATYQVEGNNLFEAMRNTPAYKNVLGPDSLNCRYIFEDLPTGLVPLTMLGRAVGVPTPVMDAIITLVTAMTGIDYRQQGRTLCRLGLDGKTIDEIIAMVEH